MLRLSHVVQETYSKGPRKQSPYWRDVTTLNLRPGENSYKIDIRPYFPGTIELTTKAPASLADWRAYAYSQTKVGGYKSAVATSPGQLSIGLLFPDIYRIDLKKPNGWAPNIALGELVAAGTVTKREIELDLVRGEMLLVDKETGRPLAKCNIAVRTSWEDGIRRGGNVALFQTDAEGRLTLELDAGTYSFAVNKPLSLDELKAGKPPEKGVEVHWLRAELIPSRLEL